jgi:hypothetical protein
LIAGSNVIFASSKEGAVALAPNTLETLWTTPLPDCSRWPSPTAGSSPRPVRELLLLATGRAKGKGIEDHRLGFFDNEARQAAHKQARAWLDKHGKERSGRQP